MSKAAKRGVTSGWQHGLRQVGRGVCSAGWSTSAQTKAPLNNKESWFLWAGLSEERGC